MEIALGSADVSILIFSILGTTFLIAFAAFACIFLGLFRNLIEAIETKTPENRPKFVLHKHETKGKLVYEIIEHEDSDKRVLMKERPDIKEFDPNSHEYLN